MPVTHKKCRVCGTMYEACRSAKRSITDAFHWQEVACSPECGSTYLAQVLASRLPSVATVSSNDMYDVDDEDDEDDEEGLFDDNDEDEDD